MKIRNSFVSNSSSCSFCLFGCWIEYDKENPDQFYNIEGGALKGTELSAECIGSVRDYGGFNLGMSPSKMKNEETVLEFKQRVLEAINKVLGEELTLKSLDWHVDGGYDG